MVPFARPFPLGIAMSWFRSILTFTLLSLGLAGTLSAADPTPTIRVGVIGLDNYQAVAFTELFHDPKADDQLAGIKVVAAFPAGSPDIEESVRECRNGRRRSRSSASRSCNPPRRC